MSTSFRGVTLFGRARKIIPGGMNSLVRAFRPVSGAPRFIAEAAGPYLWDANSTRYIGYVGSWGPMVVEYAYPDVMRAVQDVAAGSFSLGASTEAEVAVAEEICKLVSSAEQVRLVSSGIEATMSAPRLARGFTGRDLIVKLEGCYHGHVDSLLVKAGSGLLTSVDTTQSVPFSAGVPEDVIKHMMVLPHNDVTALRKAFVRHGKEIAAVIIESVAGNMNSVRGSNEFHQAMRALCTERDAVLILDEIMMGFRVALDCTQALYGIKPNLTCLDKVIGGGVSVAAFGGRRDIMGSLVPPGNMRQAGTLSGSSSVVAAGLITLRLIAAEDFRDRLVIQTRKSVDGLAEIAREVGVPFAADSAGGVFGIYFREDVPTSSAEVTKSDVGRFNAFSYAMLDQGVYLTPSALEAGFVSAMHDDAVLDTAFEVARKAFKGI